MWWLALILYILVLMTCTIVPLCQRKYSYAGVIIFFWTLCNFVWYVYSPMFDGPPRILKSVERSLVHGSIIQNWGNTDKCHPHHIVRAKNVEDVRVALTHGRVRVAGAGHSWTPLICSDDTVLFLDWCDSPQINSTHVSADAGCSIEQVQHALHPTRMLHGYGGIQYQTLAGGVMTSLHGAQFDSFASHVTHMKVMLANGTITDISGDDLKYWRHSMGMLGIVLKITLKTHPVQSVLVKKRLVTLEESMIAMNDSSLLGLVIDAIWSKHNTHVGLFTYSEPQNETLPHTDAHSNMFSFFYDNIAMPAQILVPGLVSTLDITSGMFTPSTERKSLLDAWDTHMGFGFLSAEYSVPLAKCYQTISHIRDVADGRMVSMYVRKLRKDPDVLAFATEDSCIVETAYLSLDPDYEKDMFAYHKHVESIIASYDGHTHWGKFYASDFTKLHIPEPFDAYRRQLDPEDTFMNDYTEQLLSKGVPKYRTFTITTRGDVWRVLWWSTVAVGIFSMIFTQRYMPAKFYHTALWICICVSVVIAKGLHQGLPDHDHVEHQAGVMFGQYACFTLTAIHVTQRFQKILAVLSALLAIFFIVFNFMARHALENEQYWSIVTAMLLFASVSLYIPRTPKGYQLLKQ